MDYVYRYIDAGNTVYVGITNNMSRRIKEHQCDTLGDLTNPVIECFRVVNRLDAELLETYLINALKPRKNKAKAGKGNVSIFEGVQFPWTEYEEGRKIPIFNLMATGSSTEDKHSLEKFAEMLPLLYARAKQQKLMENGFANEISAIEAYVEKSERALDASGDELPKEIRKASVIEIKLLKERLEITRKLKDQVHKGIPNGKLFDALISKSEENRKCIETVYEMCDIDASDVFAKVTYPDITVKKKGQKT